MSSKVNSVDWMGKLQSVQQALRSDWKWLLRFVVLFTIFVALLIPAQARIKRFSSAVAQRQHEIEIAKGAGLNFLSSVELQQIQKQSASFENGYILLSQVTSVLDKISDEAHKHHLRVIRSHSDSPVPLVSLSGGDISVKGKKLSRLPIRIRLEANFRNLGDFMKALSENSKQSFVVDEIVIEPAIEPGENNLRCDLTLIYFSA